MCMRFATARPTSPLVLVGPVLIRTRTRLKFISHHKRNHTSGAVFDESRGRQAAHFAKSSLLEQEDSEVGAAKCWTKSRYYLR